MKTRVYVETSVPSFYFEVRKEPEMVARREWTRQWWTIAVQKHELVTSLAVYEEIERGVFPSQQQCLDLLSPLPLLPIEPAIPEIVDAYIANRVMPSDPLGDALHLALASYHRCDFLVTWNCKHLANANKFGHVRRVNETLGLFVPAFGYPTGIIGR